MTADTTQEAKAIAVTRDMLTEALTEFYLTVREGTGYLRGQVADPAIVADVLHATLSRIAAERGDDDELAKLRRGGRELGRIVVKQARTFEAARIEMIQNGPGKAMQWILSSIPDVDDNEPEDQWDGTETATQWIERQQAADRAAEAKP